MITNDKTLESMRDPRLFDDKDYYFDDVAADRACSFFPQFLTFFQGERFAGRAFDLAPWQSKDIIRPLFGWKLADGRRKYRVAYVEVPRKSGKSNLAGGIALYLLTGDKEPGAEVYGAATDRPQARIVFRIAEKLASKNEQLGDMLRVRRDVIHYDDADAFYQVLSADAYNKDGLNASGIVFDELHAQVDRRFYDVLKTSMGSRSQPILFIITTAGFDLSTLCGEHHELAKDILDGRVSSPHYLPVIYAADRDDDPFDPSIWAKANPGLGISAYVDFYEQEATQARLIPSTLNAFRRLLLNIWTEAESEWISRECWDSNAGEPPAFLSLRGRRCFAGLDLASTQDLTALVLLFPRPYGGYWLYAWHFVPADTVTARVKKDRVPYDHWIREGWVEETPGNVTDYAFVRKKLTQLRDVFEVVEVAVDPWNATQLSSELVEDGLAVVPTRQGYKTMSPALKELERLLLSQKIEHGGNPVLAWQAGHAVTVEDPAGNKKLAKNKSKEKIDGLVATCMALSRASMHAEGTGSVYEIRGIESI
jgi:phage terminase large subunit-like protein